MPGYRLIVCSNYEKEAEKVIRDEGLNDLDLSCFPSCCFCKNEKLKGFIHNLSKENYDRNILIASRSCSYKSFAQELCHIPDNVSFKILDICTVLFINSSLLEYYCRKGAYLVTPGWILSWRKELKEWGFNQKTAIDFFGECINRVILLDTEIYENIKKHLDEFSDYVKVKTEILPVGLEHFRLYISHLYREEIISHQKQDCLKKIAEANRLSADYSMSFDLIVRLVRSLKEENVILEILNFFTLLFAPRKIHFITNNQNNKEWAGPDSKEMTLEEKENLLRKIDTLKTDYEWTENKKGFRLLIKHRKEIYGIVEMEGFKFPENKEGYLNMALTVSEICGLALNNARVYSRLSDTLKKLNLNLKEKERIEANLVAINNELEDFTHTVSHDLKNPLNYLMGNLLMIREDPDLFDHLFDKALQRSKDMLDFIDQLLKMSKAGKIISQKEQVDLELDIRMIFLNASIATPDIELVIESKLPQIMGDPAKITQVLNNVIYNAIQNRDKDKKKFILRVCHKTEKEKIIICFNDNGKGIEERYLKNLFKAGFTLRKRGTGFGLNIIRKIMNAHVGDIRIESDGLKKGARVYLEFPVS